MTDAGTSPESASSRLRGLCHAAQEEDNGQQQPDFDGDRKIEYNGKQEGDNEYRHV